jgi:hypothetical protein
MSTDEQNTPEEFDPNLNLGTTPHYNEPEDADRYPVAIPAPIPAHTVIKGDPQIDGPYLDDIREAEAEARRESNDRVSEIQRQKAKEGQEALDNLRKANELLNPSAAETAPTHTEDVSVPSTEPTKEGSDPENPPADNPEGTPNYSGGFTPNPNENGN